MRSLVPSITSALGLRCVDDRSLRLVSETTGPVPLLIPLALVTLMVITLDVAAMLPSPLYGIHLPVVTQMALIIAFIVAQWLAARDEPANRAAMRWMGLSVILGCSVFFGGVAIPMVLDWGQVLTQGYTFAFFAMIYAGIALGIRRYRLFDLGEWSFRILFYAGGAVLFLAVDAILIWLLHVERAPALGIALVLVGLIYLPARDMLARRMLARNDLEQHELFAASLKVAFAPNLRSVKDVGAHFLRSCSSQRTSQLPHSLFLKRYWVRKVLCSTCRQYRGRLRCAFTIVRGARPFSVQRMKSWSGSCCH